MRAPFKEININGGKSINKNEKNLILFFTINGEGTKLSPDHATTLSVLYFKRRKPQK